MLKVTINIITKSLSLQTDIGQVIKNVINTTNMIEFLTYCMFYDNTLYYASDQNTN